MPLRRAHATNSYTRQQVSTSALCQGRRIAPPFLDLEAADHLKTPKWFDRPILNDHNSHMNTAGVAELKARLASYLKQVKSGNEILISDRGSPVAKLVPIDAAQKRDARRLRLAAGGLLKLGKRRMPKSLLVPPKGPANIGEGVLSALLAERAEGR